MSTPRNRRRVLPLAWLGGLLGALVLTLGISGTLSSWTQALITNDTNTAGATLAVALSETNGTVTCDTVSTSTNSLATCNINKYGGDLAMSPGDSKVVNVTFTNTGNGPAEQFVLTPGTCTDVAGNLCTDGNLTVAVACSDGTTFNSGAAYTDMKWAAAAPGTQATVKHNATIAAGAKITCQFTTTLKSTAPASVAGYNISQPLTWTLNKTAV